MSDPTTIHPSAIVSAEAHIGCGVAIGPYAVIEGAVKIGDGCHIAARAQIVGDVTIGRNCRIGGGAIIGEDPQDLGFDTKVSTGVRIGRDNVVGEFVTIHRSACEGGQTLVGDNNGLRGGCHLAHDVCIGDDNLIGRNCLLAGHVQVGSHTWLRGGTVVHQFIRLGDYCMTQGNSAISKDVPPYVVAYRLNRFGGLNAIGLRRAGFDQEKRSEIRRVVERLFSSGKPLGEAIDEVSARSWGDHAKKVVEFASGNSHKGVLLATRR